MCKIPLRFFITILIFFYGLSFSCLVSSPGAIQTDLMIQMNLSSKQYSGLFSVCSWASLTDMIHGYLIEKYFGLKLASFMYTILFLIGNTIYIIAAFVESFWAMVLGRLLFGLGSNPLCLCMSLYILHWFEGKEVNLVFGLLMSSNWLGSSLMYFISVKLLAYIRTYPKVTPRMDLAITICSLTILLTLVMVLATVPVSLMYKKKDGTPKSITPEEQEKDNNKINDNKKLKNMINFHPSVWVFTVSIVLYFITIFSFIGMSQNFFSSKYNVSVETSSNLSSLFQLIMFILTPSFGYLVDLFGRNLYMLTFGSFMSLLGFSIMSFSQVNPLVPIIILGISGATSTTVMPMFQYLAEPHQLAVVYGIAQTLSQFAMAIGSIIAGALIDHYGNYSLTIFYLSLLIADVPIIMLMWIMNSRLNNILSISSKQRRKRKEYTENIIVEEKAGSKSETTPPVEQIKEN